MEYQNWKITALRDGSMRVEADKHIMIFIQHGLANVYKMAELKQEVDVSKYTLSGLENWINETIKELTKTT